MVMLFAGHLQANMYSIHLVEAGVYCMCMCMHTYLHIANYVSTTSIVLQIRINT